MIRISPILTYLALASWLMPTASVLDGQERHSADQNLQFLLGYETYFQFIESTGSDSPPELLFQLEDDETRSILQISNHQYRQIKDLKRDFQRWIQSQIADSGQQGHSPLRKEDLEAEAGEILDRANKVLSRKQKRKLDALRKRYRAARLGIEKWIQAEGANVDSRFRDQLKGLRKKYLAETLSLWGDFSHEVRDVLTARQVEQFEEMCRGTPDQYFCGSIELLQWQHQTNGEARKLDSKLDIEPPFMQPFFQAEGRTWRLSLDGRLRWSDRQSFSPALSLMRIGNSETYGGLEILPQVQMGFVGSDSDEAERKRAALRSKGNEILKAIADKRIDEKDAMKEILALKEEFELWQVAKLYENLLPFQIAELKSVVFRRLISSKGLTFALQSYKEDFDLSRTQQRELNRIEGDVLKRTRKLGRELEEEIWSELADQIEDLDLHEMRQLLKEHEEISGVPCFLLRPENQKGFMFPRKMIE